MPAITPVAGKMPLARRLAEAVGVTQPFERLVIEIDANQPIRVYVKAPLDAAVVTNLAGIFETSRVADVTVDDHANVYAAPLCIRCGQPTMHMGDVCFACGLKEPAYVGEFVTDPADPCVAVPASKEPQR